jgi:hypothetical protein
VFTDIHAAMAGLRSGQEALVEQRLQAMRETAANGVEATGLYRTVGFPWPRAWQGVVRLNNCSVKSGRDRRSDTSRISDRDATHPGVQNVNLTRPSGSTATTRWVVRAQCIDRGTNFFGECELPHTVICGSALYLHLSLLSDNEYPRATAGQDRASSSR